VPQYFFQLPAHELPDADGVDLPDIDTARRVAVRTACAMIAQNVDDFWARREWVMTVTDDTGLALFSLTLFATDAAVTQPVEIHLERPAEL
jgi:hypothetical protein